VALRRGCLAPRIYLHNRKWTLPGIVLAFLVVSGVVGWVLPDLIVGPRRLAPLTSRLLPLAFGVGGFWLAALAWGPTWVALLVGGLLGSLLGAVACNGRCPDVGGRGRRPRASPLTLIGCPGTDTAASTCPIRDPAWNGGA
jgi:hypothetical protein